MRLRYKGRYIWAFIGGTRGWVCTPYTYGREKVALEWARRTQQMMKLGGVGTYAFEMVGHGAVKIGYSRNFRRRLRQLQSQVPYPLRVVGVLRGNREREFHDKFLRDRLYGEWFRATPEIKRAFRKEKIK